MMANPNPHAAPHSHCSHIKIGAAWVSIKQIHIKVSGAWVPVKKGYEKLQGTWHQLCHLPTHAALPVFNGAIADIVAEIGYAFTKDISSRFHGQIDSYSLNNAPTGMVISNAGVISWPAQSVAVSASGVTVLAHNPSGDTVSNTFNAKAAKLAFISTWRTAAADEAIVLPFSHQVDITVDWGDGSQPEHFAGGTNATSIPVTHVYHAVGDHQISVMGEASRPSSDITGYTRLALISIENWGDLKVKTWSHPFQRCANLESITATDQPVMLADMGRLFDSCSKLVADLSHWDMTGVEAVYFMFTNCKLINFDATWPGFRPRKADQMFNGATAFVGDLSTWDVSAMSPDNYFMPSSHYPTPMYDKLLIAWGAQTVLSGKTISFRFAKYTPGGAAEAGRNALIAQGWTINDAGPVT